VFVFYCRWFVPDLGFSVLSSSRIYYQDPKFEKSDFSILFLFFLGFQGLAVES